MQSCNHIVIIHILFSLFVFTLMFQNVGFSLIGFIVQFQ